MKYKILELLESSEDFLSGEEISSKLGISRSAVWKHIGSLKKAGFTVVSVPSKGYKIEYAPDKINPKKVETSVPGKLYFYEKTLSTNLEAKQKSDVPDRSVFLAETQTEGRGRLGRKWVTSKNGCVCMSIYVKPDVPPHSVSALTLVAGLAVSRAIENSAIKWPNDVLIGTRKVAGILTEMSAEMDKVNYVVIGIGINVNTEAFNIDLVRKATSMYLESGKKIKREDVICKVLDSFWEIYDEFLMGNFAKIRREYMSRCATLRREVVIERAGEQMVARAVDITENGELIVEMDGKRIPVNSGEVSVRGLLGYADR